MTSLAIVACHGAVNSMIQVMTVTMAALVSGVRVRVLFRDEAILSVTKNGQSIPLSEFYGTRKEAVAARLRERGLDDIPKLLREARDLGDVRLYACSLSMQMCGVGADELVDDIEVRGITAFLLEDIANADVVLTF